MYLATKAGILKIVTIVVGLIVTAVGCAAHFDSPIKDLTGDIRELCKLDDECPYNANIMEQLFVAFSIIFLILSVISLLAGLLTDLRAFKVADGGYHVVAGIFVFIGSVLLVAAALWMDYYIFRDVPGGYFRTSNPFTKFFKMDSLGLERDLLSEAKKIIRKEFKYPNKLAAGAIGMVNGIIYIMTSVVIFRS